MDLLQSLIDELRAKIDVEEKKPAIERSEFLKEWKAEKKEYEWKAEKEKERLRSIIDELQAKIDVKQAHADYLDFLHAIVNGQLKREGQFLSFVDETKVFPDELTKIFIRDFYDAFIDEALHLFNPTKRQRAVVVSGNPGIGKSSFGLYLVYRAVLEGGTVVYQRSAGDFFIFRDGTAEYFAHEDSGAPRLVPLLHDPSVVHIMDSFKPTYNKTSCITVVITSPHEDVYREFAKQARAPLLTFHRFTKAEVDLLRTCFPNATPASVDKRFEMWGGNPRAIFTPVSPTLDDDAQEIKATCFNTHPNVILFHSRMHSFPNASAATDLSTLITKGEVDPSLSKGDIEFYKFHSRQPATDFVTKCILAGWDHRNPEEGLQFLRDAHTTPELSAFYGQVFQHCALRVLMSGGEFHVRDLDTQMESKIMVQPVEGVLEFENPTDLAEHFTSFPNKAHKPTSKNFPAVDFVLPNRLIIQATMSERHSLERNTSLGLGLQPVANALGLTGTVDVYFALPVDVFRGSPTFKAKLAEGSDPFKGRVRLFALEIPGTKRYFHTATALRPGRVQWHRLGRLVLRLL